MDGAQTRKFEAKTDLNCCSLVMAFNHERPITSEGTSADAGHCPGAQEIKQECAQQRKVGAIEIHESHTPKGKFAVT